MLEVLTDYQIWVSLLTLTALEIVLGIDNLIFLSIEALAEFAVSGLSNH
jgi:predicted tellurium resistance membrane protein TerC